MPCPHDQELILRRDGLRTTVVCGVCYAGLMSASGVSSDALALVSLVRIGPYEIGTASYPTWLAGRLLGRYDTYHSADHAAIQVVHDLLADEEAIHVPK
jgi:hypothetical protein